MARNHDGITLPQGADPKGLGIGVVLLGAGVGAGLQLSWLAGVPLILIALLFVGNSITGTTRIRITHSKLLVEHERPVRSFLIGPKKERVAWSDWAGASVVDHRGQPVLQVQGGEGPALGKGASRDELEHLTGLADDAAQRWKDEQL